MSFTLQGIDMLGIKSVVDADHFNAIRCGLLNSIGINNFKATNQGTTTPASQISLTCDRARLWDPNGNTPALAKDVDVTVDLSMGDGYTADVLTGGTASAESTYSTYVPDNAFDDDTGTSWNSDTDMNAGNPWIKYDLGVGVTATFIRVRVYWYLASYVPSSMKIQGSNNDADWDDLATVTPSVASGWEEFNFSNSTAYRYLRLYSVSGGAAHFVIREIEAIEIIHLAGAGGLDAGSVAADTWYYLWLIGKCAAGDGRATDLAGLVSLSASSPTMPSGYTHRRLVGVCRTDASKYIIDFIQIGADWLYGERQQVVYRTSTIARTTQSLADFVPPEALVGLITFRSHSPNSNSEAGGYLYVTGAENDITWFDSDKIEESQTTLWLPVPGQEFDYSWNDTVGANYLYVYCLGFRWPINKEP